jgi:hypothetical protein
MAERDNRCEIDGISTLGLSALIQLDQTAQKSEYASEFNGSVTRIKSDAQGSRGGR